MPRSLRKEEITQFRDKLCSAAEELYEKGGSSGITMRELARSLNVSAMTPYRYFKDKDAIIACVQTRVRGYFYDYMSEERTQIPPTADLCQQAKANTSAYIHFRRIHPGYYKLMLENYCRPTDANSSEGTIQTAAKRSIDKGNGGSKEHQYREEYSDDFNNILWAVMHGICTLGELGIVDRNADIERFSRETAAILARGCQASEPSPQADCRDETAQALNEAV